MKLAAFLAGFILAIPLIGRAVDQELASGAGVLSERGIHQRSAASAPYKEGGGEGQLSQPRSESTIQGKNILWWHRRTIQARKDANKRQLTIFRLKRENVILRKKIEWQLERRVGNRSHWLCIHRGERGAAGWATNTGNGYFGGLQMDWSFMRTYGPELLRSKGTADRWTMEEQMMVAERARASGRGYWPWPNTARRCGLL